jgi:hypothetical protein
MNFRLYDIVVAFQNFWQKVKSLLTLLIMHTSKGKGKGVLVLFFKLSTTHLRRSGGVKV